jgi:hypothetical protein
VGVVERHPADAVQAREHAGPLVAKHLPELGDAYRKVPIRVLAVLEDHDVMGAVHRPQHELFILELHGRVHVVAVVIPMPRDLVERRAGELLTVHVVVARRDLEIDDVAFDDTPHRGELGKPQRQPLPHFRREMEEVLLPSDAPVIAAAGFLEAL